MKLQRPTATYAIPYQDNIFSSLIGALFFSYLDMNKGYHQVELDEESRKLTAFITEEFGLWEYSTYAYPLDYKTPPRSFNELWMTSSNGTASISC